MAGLSGSHAGQHGRDPMQYAADIHVDHAVPFIDLDLMERRESMMPALFTSTSTDAKGGERFDVSEAGDVDRAACDNAAGFPNLRSNFFQPILAARAKDHSGTSAGQRACSCFSDA